MIIKLTDLLKIIATTVIQSEGLTWTWLCDAFSSLKIIPNVKVTVYGFLLEWAIIRNGVLMSPTSQYTMYMILSSKTQLLTGQYVTCELPVATGQAYLELNKLHMFDSVVPITCIYLALYTLEFRMVEPL